MTDLEPDERAPREQQLADTFVALTDTLVDDFDLTDMYLRLVHACVDVLGSAAAGLMLADRHENLQVVAASTHEARTLELFELQVDEGPCLDCFRTGVAVEDTTLEESGHERWPQFVPRAQEVGFTRVQALPMRLRRRTIGALNLFGDDRTGVAEADRPIAQALADVATIALLQQRAVNDSGLLAEQLQIALNERLVIEQAKGVLAERGDVEVGAAFALLRRWARNHRVTVAGVAREVVEGDQDADDILALRWPTTPSTS